MTDFTYCFGVFIADFEQVNASWGIPRRMTYRLAIAAQLLEEHALRVSATDDW